MIHLLSKRKPKNVVIYYSKLLVRLVAVGLFIDQVNIFFDERKRNDWSDSLWYPIGRLIGQSISDEIKRTQV